MLNNLEHCYTANNNMKYYFNMYDKIMNWILSQKYDFQTLDCLNETITIYN